MKTNKREPNYRALFVIGLSFIGAGISLSAVGITATGISILAVGMVFLIIGVSNRIKWANPYEKSVEAGDDSD